MFEDALFVARVNAEKTLITLIRDNDTAFSIEHISGEDAKTIIDIVERRKNGQTNEQTI